MVHSAHYTDVEYSDASDICSLLGGGRIKGRLRDDEKLWGDEIKELCKGNKAAAELVLALEGIKRGPMMEEGVGQYAVEPPSNRLKVLERGVWDVRAAGKPFG
eukprot:CAMPEP_0173437818 /NCGR_PEP_ID=MMETSP1357-20121228/18494_1 /TAXON_ID=77926 /ORGANISM="Hemiselmis rufescens, Strain PCC563" /LENGTH=102 /DNA_ID=CAMNT_0014403025 /DNA_START=98 /DNA_END=406 /DNA_ORIENTATION=+